MLIGVNRRFEGGFWSFSEGPSSKETLDVDYSAVHDSFRGISGLLDSSTMGLPFQLLFGCFKKVGGTLGVWFI